MQRLEFTDLKKNLPNTVDIQVDPVPTPGEEKASLGRIDGGGDDETRETFSLPPVDSGWRAWAFLAASFLLEGIVNGFPSAFGVFLDDYLRDPVYNSQKSAGTLLPLIGPMSAGVMYCSSLLINPVIHRYPYHARYLMVLGTAICFASLFGASFTTRVGTLVALQGALYAVGGSFLYYPCIMYGTEWFVKRRGLANGVISAGTAFGGLLFPLFLPILIEKHGSAKALRYLAIITTAPLIPCLIFVKGRLPQSTSRIRGPEPRGLTDGNTAPNLARQRDWLKDGAFWAMMVSSTLQAFAYFVPLLWLPTFTTSLNISPAKASYALAALNGSSVFGRIFLGHLADLFDPWLMSFIILAASSITTFVLWGVVSSTYAGILAFGLTYGVFAGSYTSLWIGCMRPMTRDDPRLTAILIGYLMFSRGIGSIVSTPISSVLSANSTSSALHYGERVRSGFQVDGGRYEKMIVYVGTCFAVGALISVAGWFAELKKIGRAKAPPS